MSLTRAAAVVFPRALTLSIIALVMAGDMTPTIAQTIRATLTGTVIDPNGGIVQGAAVTATNVATNISNDDENEQEGIYTFTALAPGEYVLEVGEKGFKRSVQRGIVLQIAQATRLDVPLEVGQITEEVRVVGEAQLVRSTSSELGQVIDYKQIQSLPLNGRLFQQLVTLTPGAVARGFADFAENPAAAGARSVVHHSVNGMPWSGNNYLLDGVANNEPLNAFINVTPPLEAIQEFKVQTNNPSGGVRGVRRRCRQPHDPIRNQPTERLGVRVLPGRFAERAQFLRRDQGALQLTPVRRHGWRPDPEESRVLLRRLSGTAAGSGTDVPDHRPDSRDADGKPERRSATRSSIRPRANDSPATSFPPGASTRLPDG